MKESHQQHPAGICKALDRCPIDIPNQAVSLGKVLSITHGDHGVIHQGEIAFAINDEGRSENEGQVERPGCEKEYFRAFIHIEKEYNMVASDAISRWLLFIFSWFSKENYTAR